MRPRFRKSILGKEYEIQLGQNTTENLHDTSVSGTILVDSEKMRNENSILQEKKIKLIVHGKYLQFISGYKNFEARGKDMKNASTHFK